MIFDRLSASEKIETRSMLSSSQEFTDFVKGKNNGVSESSAMRLSAVYSCINVLSSSLAQLPLHVLRREGDNVSKATDHAAFHLLKDSPNTWQTSYDFREVLQAQVLGWGNGYGHIKRTRRGELSSIDYVKSSYTTLERRGNRYFYASQSEELEPLTISIDDMIHIKAIGSKQKMGVSPIRQHAQAIGLGLAAQSYGKNFFENGGKPTGIVSAKSINNADAFEKLLGVWNKIKQRLNSSEDGGAILLPADLDYKPITVSPEDAQFLETRKFNRSEIAGIFNVPSHMINDLDQATFSNISEQAIQFVRHTMMPWVVKWEQELNRKLFTQAERAAGYYCKFNLAGLLRGTPSDRAEFYHKGITDGWLNRNEVRAFEELNPRDGLDDFLISTNATKLENMSSENGDNNEASNNE